MRGQLRVDVVVERVQHARAPDGEHRHVAVVAADDVIDPEQLAIAGVAGDAPGTGKPGWPAA